MPTYRDPEKETEGLHRLLLRAVPENDRGNRTILHLSGLLGVTRWSIQKWIAADRIPARWVPKLVALNQGVKREEFLPYLLHYNADTDIDALV